jgi:hypothetical protein
MAYVGAVTVGGSDVDVLAAADAAEADEHCSGEIPSSARANNKGICHYKLSPPPAVPGAPRLSGRNGLLPNL